MSNLIRLCSYFTKFQIQEVNGEVAWGGRKKGGGDREVERLQNEEKQFCHTASNIVRKHQQDSATRFNLVVTQPALI